jgi:hypothetical protein
MPQSRYFVTVPYREESRTVLAVAVAVLVRLDADTPTTTDVERWVRQIDDAMIRVFNGDERTPIGVAISASTRDEKQAPGNLILHAALACPDHFERSQRELPVRTVAEFDASRGGITN